MNLSQTINSSESATVRPLQSTNSLQSTIRSFLRMRKRSKSNPTVSPSSQQNSHDRTIRRRSSRISLDPIQTPSELSVSNEQHQTVSDVSAATSNLEIVDGPGYCSAAGILLDDEEEVKKPDIITNKNIIVPENFASRPRQTATSPQNLEIDAPFADRPDEGEKKPDISNQISLLVPIAEMETDSELEEDDLVIEDVIVKTKSTTTCTDPNIIVPENLGSRPTDTSISPQGTTSQEIPAIGNETSRIKPMVQLDQTSVDVQYPAELADYVHYCPWTNSMTLQNPAYTPQHIMPGGQLDETFSVQNQPLVEEYEINYCPWTDRVTIRLPIYDTPEHTHDLNQGGPYSSSLWPSLDLTIDE